ncbi:MAG TPA: hypothetical protein V6C65_03990 [Allocoleopsis sp.]
MNNFDPSATTIVLTEKTRWQIDAKIQELYFGGEWITEDEDQPLEVPYLLIEDPLICDVAKGTLVQFSSKDRKFATALYPTIASKYPDQYPCATQGLPGFCVSWEAMKFLLAKLSNEGYGYTITAQSFAIFGEIKIEVSNLGDTPLAVAIAALCLKGIEVVRNE